MLVIICICIFLLLLHVEYLTFTLLLLYLGGILVFFLFVAIMLSNEYNTARLESQLPLEAGVGSILGFKICLSLAALNENVVFFMSKVQYYYIPTHITNNIFITDLYQIDGDTSYFISLYTDKYIYIGMLGLLLLFSMIGIVLIVYQDE